MPILEAKTFDQLQEEGSKRFKVDWLVMTQHMIDTASTYGFDYTKPENKQLLAALTYKVLAILEHDRKERIKK